MDNEVIEGYSKMVRDAINEVGKVIVGKEKIIKIIFTSLISGGHILIEGLPGTAKTTLAKAVAKSVGGSFKRIQFTPDTLPSDIIGFYIYSLDGNRKLIKGPVFTNILLADELNRAPPRTQAALLEAMQEYQVTIEGESYILPKPFMVIATQLPYGYTGTYPLPEVQLDRFMFRVWSESNPPDEEVEIVGKIDYIDEMPIEKVLETSDIIEINKSLPKIHVETDLIRYMIELSEYIKRQPEVLLGPSIRGVIALYKGSRALALIEGRDYVIPDDVKYLAHPSLDHRIKVRAEAEIEGVKPEDLVERALNEVPVPK